MSVSQIRLDIISDCKKDAHGLQALVGRDNGTEIFPSVIIFISLGGSQLPRRAFIDTVMAPFSAHVGSLIIGSECKCNAPY